MLIKRKSQAKERNLEVRVLFKEKRPQNSSSSSSSKKRSQKVIKQFLFKEIRRPRA
jgi:hypothetical protein